MIGKWMSIDSQEYKDLMEKWSREAWTEETAAAAEESEAAQDMKQRT